MSDFLQNLLDASPEERQAWLMEQTPTALWQILDETIFWLESLNLQIGQGSAFAVLTRHQMRGLLRMIIDALKLLVFEPLASTRRSS